MKLHDYIKKRGITVKRAADELGYTRQWIYQVLSGKPPGRVLSIRIVNWSKGKVKLKDLIVDQQSTGKRGEKNGADQDD